MKRKIKKIFLEVVSNAKSFKKKFYEVANDQNLPNLHGINKGEDWTTLNTVYNI